MKNIGQGLIFWGLFIGAIILLGIIAEAIANVLTSIITTGFMTKVAFILVIAGIIYIFKEVR